jgi:hypothetical protein
MRVYLTENFCICFRNNYNNSSLQKTSQNDKIANTVTTSQPFKTEDIRQQQGKKREAR